MNTLKLIYNAFCNMQQTANYVKNGKGTGLSLLALTAFLMTAALFTKGIIAFYPEFNGEKIEEKVKESISRLPRIEILDGKLRWDDNVKERFVLGNGLHLTIDTTKGTPTIREIQSSFIYLTKQKLYVYSAHNNQVRDVELRDFQKITGQNPMNLTSEESEAFLINFIKNFILFFAFFSFILIFFFYWIGNIIFTALTRSIATNFSKNLAKREYSEVRRLATISTIPVIIVLDLMQILFAGPQSWVKWIAILVIGTILMLKHDSQQDNLDSVAETKTDN